MKDIIPQRRIRLGRKKLRGIQKTSIMKIKMTGLFIVTALLSAFTISEDKGKIVKAEAFQSFIDTIGLTFTMPADYKET